MSNRNQMSWWSIITGSFILSVSGTVQGQEAPEKPAGRNMAEMKFVMIPGLPTCGSGSVQSGDPTKGSSIILAKMAAGCSIPWHWHTPNEHVMMVSGVALMEMKDGAPLTLRAGGFAMMPSRHVHQFRCGAAPCALYIYSNTAFDIHYVDGEGKEILPEQALKAVRETAAKEMK